MKSNELWTALGIGVFGAAIALIGASMDGRMVVLVGSGIGGFGVIRAMWWAYSNLSSIARRAGDIAAKGADHVDTFKEAFKEGRKN